MVKGIRDEVTENEGVYQAVHSCLHLRYTIEVTAVDYRVLDTIDIVGYTWPH